MTIETRKITLSSEGFTDIQDITPQVENHLAETNLNEGTVTLFVPGSTAALSTIEFEPGLLKDIPAMLDQIAPYDRDYEHHKTWGDRNGAAHLRAPLFGPSLVVPFVSGRLMLGTWQQIVFMDFDDRPRQREIVCQIQGL